VTWTNILAPLSGGDLDSRTVRMAKALAAPFGATVTAAYAATSASRLFSWGSESGFGATDLAIGALQRVTSAGEARARTLVGRLDYPYTRFETVPAEEWQELRACSRLADLIVWNPEHVRGHAFFASAFQQILMEERRPVFIAERPPVDDGVVAIAWDGSPEASRAARRAIPWLQRAYQVVILSAPHAMARPCEPARLQSYLADHSIAAESIVLHSRGEVGPLILKTVRDLRASILVAGAFGHPRLQRFIFGGTTRALLEEHIGAALFLSH
jgi:nucleotide-binding universal stress UspA family protein